MKKLFYPRLAWTGIRKNQRIYLPYLLTCAGMVMMFYIMAFLAGSPTLAGMTGGDILQSILGFGVYTMGIFSLIFLLYTHSFLIRCRKKEFGLYNILGMGKWNLIHVMLWENLLAALLSLAGGLAGGIVFSKLAQLVLVRLLQGENTFTLTVEPEAVLITLKVFAVIFLLILLPSLWQVRLSSPMELLRSENMGEKPPRANYLLALLGACLLGGAYYLAVTIQHPVDALLTFFVAVVMVILATYLLFIAGSVTFCRLLQKKKDYYYRTDHFVSVSSMVYRMKRNGAGLASICILCTMVLVMLTATVCLYVGVEDSLRSRYPRNIVLSAQTREGFPAEKQKPVYELVNRILREHQLTAQNLQDYQFGEIYSAYIADGKLAENMDVMGEMAAEGQNGDSGDPSPEVSEGKLWQVFLISLEDYNALMGKEEVLREGEVLLYGYRSPYQWDSLTIPQVGTYQVRGLVKDFIDLGDAAMAIIPSLYVILPDYEGVMERLRGYETAEGAQMAVCRWNLGFDLEASPEEREQIYGQLQEELKSLGAEGKINPMGCENVAHDRGYFYSMYGGLFFLGILLGLVFLFAAVLIIYYKQVSEGYEDQSRFGIMRKVGMTGKEIRKSINSQILTVFFAPLLTAGLHLCFAFPLLNKLLAIFSFTNLKLMVAVTCGSFLLFGLFYVAVYRLTSRAYFQIVSG